MNKYSFHIDTLVRKGTSSYHKDRGSTGEGAAKKKNKNNKKGARDSPQYGNYYNKKSPYFCCTEKFIATLRLSLIFFNLLDASLSASLIMLLMYF